jgi:glucose/arabinose dehydrogenase
MMKKSYKRPLNRAFLTLMLIPLLLCAAQAKAHEFTLEIVTDGLDFPWAVEQLPAQEGFIITEKPGRLVHVDLSGTKTTIDNLPPLVSRRQGGLLDVALDPDFADNRMIYLSYVGRGQGGTSTEFVSARLTKSQAKSQSGMALEDIKVIFSSAPKMRSDLHFGSRLAVLNDGTLMGTLGDRFKMDEAQNNQNHRGTIVRINKDGSIPADNPFVDDPSALPAIYSYGHRNVQGLAVDPQSGTIWSHEHGPQGGDEVNIIKSGLNYGWPEITYGINYDGNIISNQTHKEGMAQPLIHWTPSIAPCGMALYQGDQFPNWRGDLFVGALAGTHLRHLEVEGEKIISQTILLDDLGERIRDVHAGHDGFIYVITDSHDGHLYRLRPAFN